MSISIRVSIRTPESSVFNTISDIDCLVPVALAAIVEEKAVHIGGNGCRKLIPLDMSHRLTGHNGTAKVNVFSIREPVMYSRLIPGSTIVHRDRAKRKRYRFDKLGFIAAVFKDIYTFLVGQVSIIAEPLVTITHIIIRGSCRDGRRIHKKLFVSTLPICRTKRVLHNGLGSFQRARSISYTITPIMNLPASCAKSFV